MNKQFDELFYKALAEAKANRAARGQRDFIIRGGKVVGASANLAGIRRAVNKEPHRVRFIDIKKLARGEARLQIAFEDGREFETQFASYEVLKGWLANWRNARGIPLQIDGRKVGEIDPRHPDLASSR